MRIWLLFLFLFAIVFYEVCIPVSVISRKTITMIDSTTAIGATISGNCNFNTPMIATAAVKILNQIIFDSYHFFCILFDLKN